ncbi:MAG: helix-turn-helix domain-containing protein [Rhodothermaceae bacterium]
MTSTKKTIEENFKELLTFDNVDEKINFEAEILSLNVMHKVKNLMDENNMNKKQLADKLNVSRAYVTRLFSADKLVNFKVLAKLQRVFDIKFDIIPMQKNYYLDEVIEQKCKIVELREHSPNIIGKGSEYNLSKISEKKMLGV